MEYLTFFELDREPFQNEPDGHFYFESSAHSRAYMRLLRGVSQRKGLSLLIGAAGCGKTMLGRHLYDALDTERWAVRAFTITHAGCVSGWLLPAIARTFGVLSPATTGPELLSQIEAQLGGIIGEGRHPVLIVDEAQMLHSASVMEEFRGLLNLTFDGRKLISLVLLGLDELPEILGLDASLAQRVEIRMELSRLPDAEVAQYVAHRLGRAGASRPLFKADAIEALARYSSGIPRLINTLADNALFEGSLDGVEMIDGSLVALAADDLGLRLPVTGPSDDTPTWVESVVPAAETDFENSIAFGDLAGAVPDGESIEQIPPPQSEPETSLEARVEVPSAGPGLDHPDAANMLEFDGDLSMGRIVRQIDESEAAPAVQQEESSDLPEPPELELDAAEDEPMAFDESTLESIDDLLEEPAIFESPEDLEPTPSTEEPASPADAPEIDELGEAEFEVTEMQELDLDEGATSLMPSIEAEEPDPSAEGLDSTDSDSDLDLQSLLDDDEVSDDVVDASGAMVEVSDDVVDVAPEVVDVSDDALDASDNGVAAEAESPDDAEFDPAVLLDADEADELDDLFDEIQIGA